MVNDADRPARRTCEVLPLFEAAPPHLIRRESWYFVTQSPMFSKLDPAMQRPKSMA